jgi:hypothetical protein
MSGRRGVLAQIPNCCFMKERLDGVLPGTRAGDRLKVTII